MENDSFDICFSWSLNIISYFGIIFLFICHPSIVSQQWAKCASGTIGTFGKDKHDGNRYIVFDNTKTDWTQYIYEFTATAGDIIHRFTENNLKGTYWVDDVVIREIDEEGNYLSGNLVAAAVLSLQLIKCLRTKQQKTEQT